MNKERSAFEKIRLGKQEIISFLLPLLAMLGIFVAKGVFPFGKESFLRTDLYHQYAPFFQEFQRKLQSGESLLYSFHIGLGSNFIALIAYYLAIFRKTVLTLLSLPCFMPCPVTLRPIPGM